MMELIAFAGQQSIGQIVLKDQADQDGVTVEALSERMGQALSVMRQSVEEGLNPALRSVSGMSGGQAAKLLSGVQAGQTAMAAAECNACMGKIVAAPTAGSCGIVPGALLMAQRQKGYGDGQLIEALFTAAGVGRVIATRASVAGAEGGCQAECGSAAAMAAAALVELGGGSPRMAGHAVGFALMNVMRIQKCLRGGERPLLGGYGALRDRMPAARGRGDRRHEAGGRRHALQPSGDRGGRLRGLRKLQAISF